MLKWDMSVSHIYLIYDKIIKIELLFLNFLYSSFWLFYFNHRTKNKIKFFFMQFKQKFKKIVYLYLEKLRLHFVFFV
jgi:hypothetical protein